MEEKEPDKLNKYAHGILLRALPLYLKLNKQHDNAALRAIQHECFPGFNCFKDAALENWRSYPEFSIKYPRPVYISPGNPNKIDVCHHRSREYLDYITNLRRYHTWFKTHKKRKHYRNAMKKGTYPQLVLRFAELLELNPDPYFSGRYDWYYSGGNLVVVDGQNIVLHAIGDDLDALVVSEIPTNNDSQILMTKLVKVEKEKYPEIFEIQTIQSSPKVTFSVRRKHKISLHTYEEGNLECNFSFTQENVPYISSTSDPYKQHAFITSDLEKTVRLWDVNKSTTVPLQILFTASDKSGEKDKNWNCVRYFNRDIYAFAGLNEFTLLDTRVPSDRTTHAFGSFEKCTDICETISSMCVSSYENLIYFGSTHKMFAVDMRYLGKEMDAKYMVIRWTHQMEMSPLILRTYRKENTEFIIGTSSISGDVRYFENIRNNNETFTSPCLPVMPPSLLDAYNNARLRGKCLNPTADLKNRITMCTSGMSLYKDSSDLFTLISNSNGDVFSQKIKFGNREDPSEEENAARMEQWEKDTIKIREDSSFGLNATKIENLSGMSKIFRCNRLDSERQSFLEEEPIRPRRLLKWQKPIEQLREFKDALAADLLSIWDFDLDVKREINVDVKEEEETDLNNRVEQWLVEAPEIRNLPPELPMVSISEATFQTITENNESHQNLFDTSSVHSGDLRQRLAYATTKSKTSVPRKSKYVQGF